jgi:hypothetical protein
MYRLFLSALFMTGTASADPVPVLKGPFSARIEDSPKTTLITSTLGEGSPGISLRIDWMNQSPEPTAFTTGFDAEKGVATSTYNLGTAHITRTILATKEAIFLHFIADQPGALSFRTTILPADGKGLPAIANRRELAWKSPVKEGNKARAWVIPFESDVESEGTSILLRGEGECLVILTATTAEASASPIADTWRKICATHDPGQNPPDPTKIWQAILARATAP